MPAPSRSRPPCPNGPRAYGATAPTRPLLATPRGVANTPAPRRRGTRFPTLGRASIRGRLEAYLGRGGLQRPSPLRLAQAAAQPSAPGGLREVAPGAPLRRGPRRAHRLHGLLRRADDARGSGKGGRQPLAGGERLR